MKQTIYGVVGYKGKLGSLLVRRPNFVPIDCDITNIDSIRRAKKDFDVVVNLAAISSVDECQKYPKHAHLMNIVGAVTLMDVYGNKVLNISSDYVFGGWTFIPPTEKSKPSPLNVYGMTKMVMEDFSKHYGAKVLRLSRTVHTGDPDIFPIMYKLRWEEPTTVPTFFHRNYLTRSQAVDGIEYFVRNFDTMPQLVNYGSAKPISFQSLIYNIARRKKMATYLLEPRHEYNDKMTPRPKKAGFSVGLAKKLGFPIYTMNDVVEGVLKDGT